MCFCVFGGLLRLVLPLCCGFVAGPTSISSRIYRYVADVAGPEGGSNPEGTPSTQRSLVAPVLGDSNRLSDLGIRKAFSDGFFDAIFFLGRRTATIDAALNRVEQFKPVLQRRIFDA